MAFQHALKRQRRDPAEVFRIVSAMLDEIKDVRAAVIDVKRDTSELKVKIDAVKADIEKMK